MTDQTLTILKGCLIALLYLFLLRVVWVVSRELRGTPLAAGPPPVPVTKAAAAPRRARPAPAWRLETHEPAARRGSSTEITAETTIGRGGGCAISLPDDTFVSTLHARVFPRDDVVWIEDLGSTNGTAINGTAITTPTALRKGDRIEIGGSVFEVTR